MIDNELKVIEVLNQAKFKLSPLKLKSDDQYSFNDAYNKNIIAELKHRQFVLGTYPDYMLEKDKYLRLMDIACATRRVAYYDKIEKTVAFLSLDHATLWGNLPKSI